MDKENIQSCKGCSNAGLGWLTLLAFLIFPGVKTKNEIITEIANARVVETMVENIAHQPLSANLKDLCQMVYVILLEYEEQKVVELYENNQMQYFIARIIINQYRSSNSPYHALFRKFQLMVDNDLHTSLGLSDDLIESFNTLDTWRVLRYGQGE